jgi:hypothetical protein
VTAGAGGQDRPVSDRAVVALASEVERLSRTVDRVEETANTAVRAAANARGQSEAAATQLGELGRQVAGLAALGTQIGALADRVAGLAVSRPGGSAGRAGAEVQVSWFEADGEQAAALLLDVAQWVYDVLWHYRSVTQQLSDCWRRHPSVVEALLALRSAWFAAYHDPEARPTAAVDWHIRHLPGTVDLLREELRGCSELNHGPGGDVERFRRTHPRVAPDDSRLVEYADWWAAARGEGTEPGLKRTPNDNPR